MTQSPAVDQFVELMQGHLPSQGPTGTFQLVLAPEVRAILERPLDAADVKQDVYMEGSRFQPRYPPSDVVIKRLNEAFGSAWSHQLVAYSFAPDWSGVISHVRVTVKLQYYNRGQAQGPVVDVSHEGIGWAFIRKNPAGGMEALGDTIKASVSDAIRKAATYFGFGLELYNRDETPYQNMTLLPGAATGANLPAPEWQVQKVIDILETHYRQPRAHWMHWLQVTSTAQITVGVAQQIINGSHPVVVGLSGQAAQAQAGITSRNA